MRVAVRASARQQRRGEGLEVGADARPAARGHPFGEHRIALGVVEEGE